MITRQSIAEKIELFITAKTGKQLKAIQAQLLSNARLNCLDTANELADNNPDMVDAIRMLKQLHAADLIQAFFSKNTTQYKYQMRLFGLMEELKKENPSEILCETMFSDVLLASQNVQVKTLLSEITALLGYKSILQKYDIDLQNDSPKDIATKLYNNRKQVNLSRYLTANNDIVFALAKKDYDAATTIFLSYSLTKEINMTASQMAEILYEHRGELLKGYQTVNEGRSRIDLFLKQTGYDLNSLAQDEKAKPIIEKSTTFRSLLASQKQHHKPKPQTDIGIQKPEPDRAYYARKI